MDCICGFTCTSTTTIKCSNNILGYVPEMHKGAKLHGVSLTRV